MKTAQSPTNNSSYNINKILCSEKGNTVFTDPKDRQVKHYYPKKIAVTLNIGSGQKQFVLISNGPRETASLISNGPRETASVYMEFNLYLWEIIFEFDVVALTIETIKLVFKPLDIF